MRAVVLGVAAAVLMIAPPAFALSRTETSTEGAVTATFSYDYKKTRYGFYDFSNLHVTIDRSEQRLVDELLGAECMDCSPWPADGGSAGASSVTARDLDGDGEPEVLVDLYTGGANCCFYTDAWYFDAAGGKYVLKVLRPGLSFPYTLKDLDRDGRPEFYSEDYRFAYKYGSNADTPRPLRIWDWDAGRLVDVTKGYPKPAARDAASMYRVYLEMRRVKGANLRGVLAAYLADSYNAGQGRTAWRRVVAAYRRGELRRHSKDEFGPFGKAYLKSVRAFLKKLGYLRRA
jgi:hypothetical protein